MEHGNASLVTQNIPVIQTDMRLVSAQGDFPTRPPLSLQNYWYSIGAVTC